MASRQFHLYLYGPDLGPIDVSFETAAENLQLLEKLYLEPDGSFVWARDGGEQQVFGMIYDARDQIQYLELRGKCELSTWQTLIQAAVGSSIEGVCVLHLPDRQLQDLQDFETGF